MKTVEAGTEGVPKCEAAFAAGENAGPNNMINTSIDPINMRCGPLFRKVFDKNPKEENTLLGKSDKIGRDMGLAST